MNVLAARYTEWFSGMVEEYFDGVKVTRLGMIPADCTEAILLGYSIVGDINEDCVVDLLDFCEMAQIWLGCVNPQDMFCDRPWDI